MSYTEIFAFKKSGEIESIAEIKNAHRGASSVWQILEKRYLPKTQFPRMVMSMTNLNDEEDPMQEIWDLWKRDDVTLTDKIVLLSTFDYVVCLKEDLPKLFAAFQDFVGETSLKEQADSILKVKDDPDLWAIGWNHTSINGDTWETFGGYDEEEGECIPYDFKTGDKHWNLFSFETNPQP